MQMALQPMPALSGTLLLMSMPSSRSALSTIPAAASSAKPEERLPMNNSPGCPRNGDKILTLNGTHFYWMKDEKDHLHEQVTHAAPLFWKGRKICISIGIRT